MSERELPPVAAEALAGYPMPETRAQVIEQMLALLETPRRWGRYYYAATARGRCIGPQEANARCWCVRGAGLLVCGGYTLLLEDTENLIRSLVGPCIATWQDEPERTHAEVLAMLRDVYTLAGGKVTR